MKLLCIVNFSGIKIWQKFPIKATFEVAYMRNKFPILATSCLYAETH